MDNFPKVLLVDDEEGLRDAICKRLQKKGMEVGVAGSGEDALDILSQEQFDVIVLDIKMPGIDGIETLERIKEINPDYEVIILSGHASLDSARRIVELGGSDYLLKPYDFDDLLIKIETAFDRKKGSCGI